MQSYGSRHVVSLLVFFLLVYTCDSIEYSIVSESGLISSYEIAKCTSQPRIFSFIFGWEILARCIIIMECGDKAILAIIVSL